MVDELVRPAVAQDQRIVIFAAERHTAATMCWISDRLRQCGLRDQAVLLWNANNAIGFRDFAASGLETYLWPLPLAELERAPDFPSKSPARTV